mmetsp:Transcript_78758/g.228655  ORF Transcript_78758/g.228655 Transcript_78758/m.228655 type:complete len:819 (+) Transcript_78758:155-2611(+)
MPLPAGHAARNGDEVTTGGGGSATTAAAKPNWKGANEVVLHVYDLGPKTAGFNAGARALGFGAFHAGVEVYGAEWSFGGESSLSGGGEKSGVFCCHPKGCTAHIYREAVAMGKTMYSPRQVYEILLKLMQDWPSQDYHPLRRNCCHFSCDFCNRLGVGDIPSWVTSLATVGAMLFQGPRLGMASSGGAHFRSHSQAAMDHLHVPGGDQEEEAAATQDKPRPPPRSRSVGCAQDAVLDGRRGRTPAPLTIGVGEGAERPAAAVAPEQKASPPQRKERARSPSIMDFVEWCIPAIVSPSGAASHGGSSCSGIRARAHSPSQWAISMPGGALSSSQPPRAVSVPSRGQMPGHMPGASVEVPMAPGQQVARPPSHASRPSSPQPQLVQRWPSAFSMLSSSGGASSSRGQPQQMQGMAVPQQQGLTLPGGPHMSEAALASEVLRLRQKRAEHDELRSKLSQAEDKVRRLPITSILKLYAYCERHFADPALDKKVPQRAKKLLECLCAVFGIDVAETGSLLDAVRLLWRDPHCFTTRLADLELDTASVSCLAPFLLMQPSGSRDRDRRAREEEVQNCLATFSDWVAAKYWLVSAWDEVQATAQELAQCEAMLGSGMTALNDMTPISGLTVNQSCSHEPSESSQSQQVRPSSPIARMGSAMIRAMSGSPVAAFVMGGGRRNKQQPQQQDDVTTPSSASTSAWGGSTVTGRGRSNQGDVDPEASTPGPRRPIERTQSASMGKWLQKHMETASNGSSSSGLERRASVPATLLGHLYPRRGGAATSDVASTTSSAGGSTRSPKLPTRSRNGVAAAGAAAPRGAVTRGR